MVKGLAREALSHFETRERYGEDILVLKDDAPSWVHRLVRHAHDGMLPDDWRYSFVLGALSAIEEGDFDGTYLEPSVYISSLTNWLASDSHRIAYCDEAYEEHGGRLVDLLQAGQLRERQETFLLVKEFLEELSLDDEHASLLGAFYGATLDD